MSKSKSSAASAPEDDPYSEWKVDDAVRTLTRAHEIEGDPKMMAKVKKRAAEQAAELTEVAGSKVAAMVKRGLISEKQAAKLKGAQ
jgi:ribosomal protein S20